MESAARRPIARIGLVLHPRRTPAAAVAPVAAWTAGHDVELVELLPDDVRRRLDAAEDPRGQEDRSSSSSP